MDINTTLFWIATISTVGFGVTLVRHIMFKRALFKLKQDMKQHSLKHGIDNALWEMFVQRTRKMLSFWQ